MPPGVVASVMRCRLHYLTFLFFTRTLCLAEVTVLHLPGDYFADGSNPVRKRELQDWRTTEFRSINNVSLEYRPIEKLFFKVYAGYDYMNLKDDKYQDAKLRNATRLDELNGLAERWETTTNNFNVNATATYFHDLTEDHKLTYLLGGEYQQGRSVANPRKFRQDGAVDGTFYDNEDLLNSEFLPVLIQLQAGWF